MRKILFLLISVLMFSSCSKDSTDDRPRFDRNKLASSVYQGEYITDLGEKHFMSVKLNVNNEAEVLMIDNDQHGEKRNEFNCSYVLFSGDVYLDIQITLTNGKKESIGGITIDTKGRYLTTVIYDDSRKLYGTTIYNNEIQKIK